MKDIEKYIEGCDMYQIIKNKMKILAEKLKLSEVLEKPQTHLIVDFITKLLLVARKDAILVVYNRLFKMTHFVATTEEISAKGLVQLFKDNIQKLHGLLKSIVSDRGLQFATKMTNELNSMLEIETKLSISFYPQTDKMHESGAGIISSILCELQAKGLA